MRYFEIRNIWHWIKRSFFKNTPYIQAEKKVFLRKRKSEISSSDFQNQNIRLLKLRAILGTVMNRCSRDEQQGLAEINLILARMMNANQMHIKD